MRCQDLRVPEVCLLPVQDWLFLSAGEVLGKQNTTVSVPQGSPVYFIPF